MEQLQPIDFCYWDVNTEVDAHIFEVIIIAIAILMTITICRLKKASKFGVHGKRIAKLYLLIILWGITFGGRLLYGTIIYWKDIHHHNHDINMNNYSRNYVRFLTLSPFII